MATKWGTKEELLALAATAKSVGIGLYWDAVLNHKFAADHRERCLAIEVDREDRNRAISDKHEIEAWVGFDFLGRGDKYSEMKWHWYHFSGVDWDAKGPDGKGQSGIFKIEGDIRMGWAAVPDVDGEKGN